MTAQGAIIDFRLIPAPGFPPIASSSTRYDKPYAWACCGPATSFPLCVRS